jgi:hypothetical protein
MDSYLTIFLLDVVGVIAAASYVLCFILIYILLESLGIQYNKKHTALG